MPYEWNLWSLFQPQGHPANPHIISSSLKTEKILYIIQTNPLWHLHGKREAVTWDNVIGTVVNKAFSMEESENNVFGPEGEDGMICQPEGNEQH